MRSRVIRHLFAPEVASGPRRDMIEHEVHSPTLDKTLVA